MLNLMENPYFLNKNEIKELYKKLSQMTIDEKIGQLFFVIGVEGNNDDIKLFIEKYKPGGMMFRPDDKDKLKDKITIVKEYSKIPIFISGNLESGGNGIIKNGTWVGNPLQIAATGNKKFAYKLGLISGYEAMQVGCNMSFSPIADIDYNFLNPITNTRTFGSDYKTVLDFAKEQIIGLKEYDIISVAKHFPGDGVDDRDQHLLSTVNSFSVKKWMSTYGNVYKSLIDNGLNCIMIGHIFQPKLEKYFNPKISDKELRPASASRILIEKLLRKKLKFNGLAITDATAMVGYNVIMAREKLLVETINAGIDMILFNKNIDEDYKIIKDAINNGKITMTRLDEAVLRILATKQSNHLFNESINNKHKIFFSNEECNEIVKEIAKKSVTLVKDRDLILPISPKKTPRIRLIVLGDTDNGGFKEGGKVGNLFKQGLLEYGFEVTTFEMDIKETFEEGVSDLKNKFDLALYVANIETASNQTTNRLEWIKLMAANAPWFSKSIPTIFISTANPYHLYDVPYISTYINAYTGNKETVDAVLRKLIGKEIFEGKNPVDPFCGSFQAKI